MDFLSRVLRGRSQVPAARRSKVKLVSYGLFVTRYLFVFVYFCVWFVFCFVFVGLFLCSLVVFVCFSVLLFSFVFVMRLLRGWSAWATTTAQ